MRALAVVGPTAGGKTALAIALAERLGGEIICCDSMQIYRDMNIGTAKPTADELSRVPHHLFDFADPCVPFSAADYAPLAMQAVREITARGHLPIFCGGTGLYLDAVRTLRHEGDAPPPNPALREELLCGTEEESGRIALWQKLREIDPAAAEATHPNNVRRVVRALEIYLTTGKTKTEVDAAANTFNPELDLTIIGLFWENRELLHARIGARVDAMLKTGLLDETRALYDAGVFEKNATAAQAIGYKELLPALAGEIPLGDAVINLKTATRRYAKRQLTYFRAMAGLIPVMADANGAVRPTDEICREVLTRLSF